MDDSTVTAKLHLMKFKIESPAVTPQNNVVLTNVSYQWPLSVNGNRNKFIVRVTLIRVITEKRTDICAFKLFIFIMLNRLRSSRDELDDINHGSLNKYPLAAGYSRKVTLTSRKLETKITSPPICTDAADKTYSYAVQRSQLDEINAKI